MGGLTSLSAARMAVGMGLHLDPTPLVSSGHMSKEEARIRQMSVLSAYLKGSSLMPLLVSSGGLTRTIKLGVPTLADQTLSDLIQSRHRE